MTEQVKDVNNIEEFTTMTNALSDLTHHNINNESAVKYFILFNQMIWNVNKDITSFFKYTTLENGPMLETSREL